MQTYFANFFCKSFYNSLKTFKFAKYLTLKNIAPLLKKGSKQNYTQENI